MEDDPPVDREDLLLPRELLLLDERDPPRPPLPLLPLGIVFNVSGFPVPVCSTPNSAPFTFIIPYK